jgi:hypothetical protein
VTKKYFLTLACSAGVTFFLNAQLPGCFGQIHGNFQIDAQYYNPDSTIGAPVVPEKALSNGWGVLTYTNGKFGAGLRYESYQNVMQGFDPRFKGQGVTYRYFTYDNDKLEITVGNSYDQFGSGLIYRTYEDRGLGFDNSLDGVRVRYNPYRGVYVKGAWGRQRQFFSLSPAIVRGFDGEVVVNELADRLDSALGKTRLILGGSFVSKYQLDQDPLFVLPNNVGAWAARFNLIRPKINFFAEYAYKINDPHLANNNIYKPGEALFVNFTYSNKGLGLSLGAKHIDNMSFRSDRSATGNAGLINYLPALTKQHTYVLSAYYPYASQPNGELSWQADLTYKFKKGTKLGGKFGTNVALNYSAAFMIDTTNLNDLGTGGRRLGYTTKWFGFNDSLFFQDVNFEMYKKVSKKFRFTFLAGNIWYNKNVVEGKSGYPIISSQYVVADLIFTLTDKLTLRTDLEHMYCKDDFGSWAAALAELTIGEHFFVAAMDQYNYGNYDAKKRVHYVNVQGGYTKGTIRVTAGYGKQRAGIFCVGGVCRFVPASNGFTLNITSSF